MYDVIDVCNYIIQYCHKKGYEITNLRLQKLLYFIQAYFYMVKNQACFHEDMEAWDLGPVVPKAYREFKSYKAGNLEVTSRYLSNTIEREDKHLINNLIDTLSRYTTFQLVDLTHHQFPWKHNYCKDESKVIPKEDIRRFANG